MAAPGIEMKLKMIRHWWVLILFSVGMVQPVQALPSFSRQTGQDCAACHVGSFGPQLTPFGQKFKLGGYTLKGGSISGPHLPLSAMIVAAFDRTSKAQPQDAGPHNGTNNNAALQEASLFVAGGITDHVGAMAQVTYSDIERKTTIDNVDVRYADSTTVAGMDTTFGISINNNPTAQDLWNTTPAWRFPYVSSDLAPGPTGEAFLGDGLAQQVVGVTAYSDWNDHIYAEAGGYLTPSTDFLKTLKAVDGKEDVNEVSGVAPYWRLAYHDDFDRQNVMAGLFGLHANVRPGRVDGASDTYDDMGVDMAYEFLGNSRHVFAVNTSYIREEQTLDASVVNGDAARRSNATDNFRLNAAYYFDETYGLTLGYFDNSGSKTDTTRDAPDPLDGSRTGLSDSDGYIVQADWTPFGKQGSWAASDINLRLGLQYTIYNKYNGASSNYDGFGRDAKDNNTLMLLMWAAM